MTQKELVGGAETEHCQRVPIQAIAKLGPDSECLKFTHRQRVDVTNSTSVKMARVCMMNRMRAAPVIVRGQRQNAEKPSYPVVRQTMAKEGTMSAIMLDHEQSYEKTGGRHPSQERQLPIAEMNRCPSHCLKRDERHECDRNLEDTARVTGLTISRESWYGAPRNLGCR